MASLMTDGGSAPLLLADAPGSLLTVNYVTKTCKHGICGSVSTRQDNPNSTGISRRQDDPNSAVVLLGINCRGSGHCNAACRRDISQLKWYIDRIGK